MDATYVFADEHHTWMIDHGYHTVDDDSLLMFRVTAAYAIF